MTVDELTSHIQGLFSSDFTLSSLIVGGELAELKKHTSGHCYFTLLGKESRIACAIFKREAGRIPQWPKNGDAVLVEGRVDLYAARGVYQLYARRIVPVGAGAVDRARQELKERLTREGLFAQELKRSIPRYPTRVALVTSPTGAAVKDVLRVAGRRYPACPLVIVPALVQGADAPEDIVRALSQAALLPALDCVLLVRGGGGREDLVPFDDERVIRAVRSSPVPVVSGVGHEVDVTLCDLAADLRAATPSAAAEMVFPDQEELRLRLGSAAARLKAAASTRLNEAEKRLSRAEETLTLRISRQLGAAREAIASRLLRFEAAVRLAIARGESALASMAASLQALSPLAVLARGFVTCERDGKRLRSVRELAAEDEVALSFSDGVARARVTGTTGKEKDYPQITQMDAD
ncbi:MAG: exodeoxyribonuclease VII large subunit [Fretibacterium sp.]|nr:exodeoxyribonuclease VII large subunit [Fretibacterium sp.]